MNRRTRIITFFIALFFGAVLAWLIQPHWQRNRALSQIASEYAPMREEGWRWFTIPVDEADTPRAAEHISAIHNTLAFAPRESLLEGGDRLRTLQLWNWNDQPHHLTLRELAYRAESHADDQRLVLKEMAIAPLDLRTSEVVPIFQMLLCAEDSSIRERALVIACGWLGRGRIGNLSLDDLPEEDDVLRRALRLAHTWADEAVDGDALIEVIQGDALSRDELEAALLQLLRARPDELPEIIAHLAEGDEPAEIALSYLLRFSEAPEARELLNQRAEHTDAAARFALQAVDRDRDQAESLRIAQDETESICRRRLAAWRSDDVDIAIVSDLLDAEPFVQNGFVYATALLAERHLPREESVELAEVWLRDLRDDRKRAGALLAALTGEHVPLVREALEASTGPNVRTTLRTALWALGEPYGEEDAEFAHRALHTNARDEFNPDIALCMLIAGHKPVVERLASRPQLDEARIRRSVQQRAMLIERFLPDWHEAIGRPSGGDVRAIKLHFDALHARWMLDHRRLQLP